MRTLILLFLFIPIALFSQKIKKDNFGYYNYMQPRASVALDDANLYLLFVEVSDNDAMRRRLIEEAIVIQKFTKAGASDTPDFTINIVESSFKFGPSQKKSYSEKDGEKTKTMYYYIGTMNFAYTLKVLDKDENEIYREHVKGTEKTKGRSSSSLTKAHDYYVKDKLAFKENGIKVSADKLSDRFNSHFVDQEKTIHVRGADVQGKKFQYPGFNKAYNDLEIGYEALEINPVPDEKTKALLNDCVAFWSEFLKEATPTDKKSRVNADVTSASHYNLGLAYFFLGNFSAAHKHFEQAKRWDNNIVAGIFNWVAVSKDCAERMANH